MGFDNKKNHKKPKKQHLEMCIVYKESERGRRENNMKDTQVGESVRTGDT